MALGFFRRHQKMVMVIMAVLMVSFLIGFQGFDRLTHRQRDDVVGLAGETKITQSELNTSASEIDLLKRIRMDLSRDFREFLQSTRDRTEGGGKDKGGEALAFRLLLIEATRAGVKVSEDEVTRTIDQLAKADRLKDADELYRNLSQSSERAVPKKAVQSAVMNWLTIDKFCQANVRSVPAPSDAYLQQAYRDLREQIDLQMVILPAMDYLPSAPVDPNDPKVRRQIDKLFNDYRTVVPGTVDPNDPMGIGYKQPNRAKVQYLLLREDIVEEVAQPSERKMLEFFGAHNKEFANKTFTEARDEISLKITAEDAGKMVDALTNRAQSLASDLAARVDPKQQNVFDAVKAQMTVDARPILETALKDVHLDDELGGVIRDLAKQAGLQVICYPTGTVGDLKIDPKIHVVLDADSITLGAALDQVTDYVLGHAEPSTEPSTEPTSTSAASAPIASRPSGLAGQKPAFKWVGCYGVEGVIFPVGGSGIDKFPLMVGATPLEELEDLFDDPILGRTSVGAGAEGATVPQLVAKAAPFHAAEPGERQTGAMERGELGSLMSVQSFLYRGKLLWRLSEAVPSYSPSLAELRTNKELLGQVIRDLKMREGYAKALETADALKQAAGTKGLEAAAKAQKLSVQTTGLFARKVMFSPQTQYVQMFARRNYAQLSQRLAEVRSQLTKEQYDQADAQIRKQALDQARAEADVYPPVEIYWQDVPGLTLPREFPSDPVPLRRQMMTTAFSLAPKNVEPPYKEQPPIIVVEAKFLQEVVVMTRVGYRPVVASEFKAAKVSPSTGLPLPLVAALQFRGQWDLMRSWFTPEEIQSRLKYEKQGS